MHRASNEVVFVHVSKNVDFCNLSKEKMSSIDPQIILDALEKSEKDAEAVKEKFLDKVKNYENVTVSTKLVLSLLACMLGQRLRYSTGLIQTWRIDYWRRFKS